MSSCVNHNVLPNRSDYRRGQINGCQFLVQRGVDPNYSPPDGCEVHVKKLPLYCTVDELFDLFSRIDRVYDVRLMMKLDGTTRRFGFVRYHNDGAARNAILMLNGRQLQGCKISVEFSTDNRTLMMLGVSPWFNKHDIYEWLRAQPLITDDIKAVHFFGIFNGKIAYELIFKSHRAATVIFRSFKNSGKAYCGMCITIIWKPDPEVEARNQMKKKLKDEQDIKWAVMNSFNRTRREQAGPSAIRPVNGQMQPIVPRDILNPFQW